MKKILSVVGARPNFMKIAPIHKELLKHSDTFSHIICHTGQHFDEKMSDIFFNELNLPKPDYFLGIGGGSHAQQTGKIIIEFEKVILEVKPDLIIVVGDVNSTLACALVAAKLNIPIAHIEAGLRSFDNLMPEEINRKLTDLLSDYLFVTEQSGVDNLLREGINKEKIYFVGNVMIDALRLNIDKANNSNILKNLNIDKRNYALVTFHRPSNVDNKLELEQLVQFLNKLVESIAIVFPIHPRTMANLEKNGLFSKIDSKVIITDPLGYYDFLKLQSDSLFVITDSGGIQEETTALGVQCLTVRNNTERPITVDVGTNQLVGTDLDFVYLKAKEIIDGKIKLGRLPTFWDGNTAYRIVNEILNF